MILILNPDIDTNSPDYRELMDYISNRSNIEAKIHHVQGAHTMVTEIYLIGDTLSLSAEDIASMPGVDRVVRVSRE